MGSDLKLDKIYIDWLKEIKLKIRNVQIKAALSVNTELLKFYWELGGEIVLKQRNSKWGDKFLLQLSKDLTAEFQDMKGFSRRNLELIRQWYSFYSQEMGSEQIAKQPVSQLRIKQKSQQLVGQLQPDQITKQLVAQITSIPWGHNIAIITKCRDVEEALYYVENTMIHNWSRRVLAHQIESGLYQREGRSVNNFAVTLPKPLSDLAQQTLKDPYIFDFLSMTKDYDERELEKGLIGHITQFLLELGAGFAYIGMQLPIKVGEREFFIDLLFYHVRLHCYVVVELKPVDFEPEHAGKLNFYIKAIDAQFRKEGDQQTIGILLCKNKDKAPRIKRLSEYIGQSYFDYLAALPDLVLLMDESHRYRASAGVRAINDLKPILGLELTATPFVETGRGSVPFKNVIYDYPLGQAMADGFVKEPAVVTRKDFNPSGMQAEQVERMKLDDGILLHERVKQNWKPMPGRMTHPLLNLFF